MRTYLTILAVAVGKLLCRFGRHKWGEWRTAINYTWRYGIFVPVYDLIDEERQCKRCGVWQRRRCLPKHHNCKCINEEVRCDTS